MQKLRKKAALVATDAIEVYIGFEAAPSSSSSSSSSSGAGRGSSSQAQSSGSAAAAANGAETSGIARVLESQSSYIAEVLGRPARALAARPPHAVVIARERHSLGADAGRCEFDIVLTAPAVSICDEALLQVLFFLIMLALMLSISTRRAPAAAARSDAL